MKIYSGPHLQTIMKFCPPPAMSLTKEYGDLELTIEAVDDVEAAIVHINKYGSSHTDSIITATGTSWFSQSTLCKMPLSFVIADV